MHLESDAPLMEAGLDSLTAMELQHALRRKMPSLRPPATPVEFYRLQTPPCGGVAHCVSCSCSL